MKLESVFTRNFRFAYCHFIEKINSLSQCFQEAFFLSTNHILYIFFLSFDFREHIFELPRQYIYQLVEKWIFEMEFVPSIPNGTPQNTPNHITTAIISGRSSIRNRKRD